MIERGANEVIAEWRGLCKGVILVLSQPLVSPTELGQCIDTLSSISEEMDNYGRTFAKIGHKASTS